MSKPLGTRKALVGAAVAAMLVGAPTAIAKGLEDQPKPLITPPDGKNIGVSSAIGWSKGFLAGFEQFNAANFSNSVLIQRFDASGAASGGPLVLQKEMPVSVGQPEFTDLGGDKFGVVWKEGAALKTVVFDAAKRSLGKTNTVVAKTATEFGHPIATLKKGDVALVARDAPKAGVENATLSILDDKMRLKSKPVVLQKGKPNAFGIDTLDVAVVAHDDGGIAAFLDKSGQISAAPFDDKGKVGKLAKVNSTPLITFDAVLYAQFRIKAAPLKNGGYVIVWTSTDPGFDHVLHLRGRAYDKKGEPVGKSDFAVSLDDYAVQFSPEVLPTKTGFLVAWSQADVYGPSRQQIRYFDEEGSPLTDGLETEYFGEYGRGLREPLSEISYAELPDGSFANLFRADNERPIFVDGVPGPTFGKDDKADTLKGGDAAETLIAAGKDDTITDKNGNDLVDGGDGVDTIDAGPGDDFVSGGPGADILSGGIGADVFLARPGGGDDVILGFETADRIDVSAFHYPSKPAVIARAAREGEDVVITLTDQQGDPAAQTKIRLKKFSGAFSAANVIL